MLIVLSSFSSPPSELLRALAIAVEVGDLNLVTTLAASGSPALLSIAVEVPGQPQVAVSLPVSARVSGSVWIARALVSPTTWADAVSVTVVSLSLAGRPLPCDCLPAILRVGYNHAPASAGAVFAAAKAGDVPAQQAALDAGGSTEEADTVRGRGREGEAMGKGAMG